MLDLGVDSHPQDDRAARCDGEPKAHIWLPPFLLLALEQRRSHGYYLIQRMSAFGFGDLDSGRVYRILRQFEQDGLVVSVWDTSSDGPARRLYSLTEAGHVYLNDWATSIRTSRSMLEQFLCVHSSAAPAFRARNQKRSIS